MQAVKRGFTSGTTKGNAGLGLDDLLNAVVAVNQGRVDILSLNGHIQFRPNGNGGVKVQTSGSVGFCPGTTIDICIKTNTIVHVPEEPEDLEW